MLCLSRKLDIRVRKHNSFLIFLCQFYNQRIATFENLNMRIFAASTFTPSICNSREENLLLNWHDPYRSIAELSIIVSSIGARSPTEDPEFEICDCASARCHAIHRVSHTQLFDVTPSCEILDARPWTFALFSASVLRTLLRNIRILRSNHSRSPAQK